MIFTVTAVTTFFPQYFWKEQFDTFDNRCNVLRAAFCNSREAFRNKVINHNSPFHTVSESKGGGDWEIYTQSVECTVLLGPM